MTETQTDSVYTLALARTGLKLYLDFLDSSYRPQTKFGVR